VKPAVFLDRDGTIIDDIGYLDRAEDAVLFPWSADALRLLARAGFAIVVITNQSGVARGLYAESVVHDVHARLTADLARGGVAVDGWYHCPHHVDAAVEAYRLDCDCRKPRPGLVIRAARELGVAPGECVLIGDIGADVEAARSAGARAVLVPTPRTRAEEIAAAPLVAPDLPAAVELALGAPR
jgi:D-glycero-D-manno-heptose 1,7-bisphosphate phosphatase